MDDIEQSSSRKRVAGVILAAGLSQRMKARKQLIEVQGEPMVRRAARIALQTNLSFVVVVVGHDDVAIINALNGLDCHLAHVLNPEAGQSQSILAGLECAAEIGCEAVLFTPCDLPLLTSSHINELVSTYHGGNFWGVGSMYDGTLGAPLIMDAILWDEVRNLQGDGGARKIVARYLEHFAAVTWEDGKVDLDTPEDLSNFLAKFPR